MKCILFLLLVLLPASAFAQATYDLSCGNVAKIRIVRIEAEHWNVRSDKGHFHAVHFHLKPNMTEEFRKLVNQAHSIFIDRKGVGHVGNKLILSANGTPLRNDAPELEGLGNDGVAIVITREQDAFDAARAVCPALVPGKVLEDGQWE